MAELRSLLNPGEPVRILAVSIDGPDQSALLAERIAKDGKGSVNALLLSDPGHRTIDAYGLLDHAYDGAKFEGIPHPAVYVLDGSGRVKWAVVEEDYRKRPTNGEIRATLDAMQ